MSRYKGTCGQGYLGFAKMYLELLELLLELLPELLLLLLLLLLQHAFNHVLLQRCGAPAPLNTPGRARGFPAAPNGCGCCCCCCCCFCRRRCHHRRRHRCWSPPCHCHLTCCPRCSPRCRFSSVFDAARTGSLSKATNLQPSSLDAAFAAARVASTFPGVSRGVSASARRERRIVRRSY